MSFLSKIVDIVPGMLKKAGLLVLRIGDLLPMLDDFLKIGITENDVTKVEIVCDAIEAVIDHIERIATQLRLGVAELREAIAENSEGGEDITLGEIRSEIMPEFMKIGELAEDTDEVISDVVMSLKALK